MVRFSLVGVPQSKGAGGDDGRLERRDAALLALLCLGGAHSRATLAALLWPQSTPDRARNSLRQRLHRLKRTAGREVVRDDGLLHLVPDVVEAPAAVLERLRADPAAPAGELLEGLRYDIETELDHWLQAQRERWRQTVADRLAGCADELEAAGQPRQALPYARRLVDWDPGLEAGHVRLVRLLYASGDSNAALAAHAQATRDLRRLLGTGPGPELQGLARLVRESLVRVDGSPAVQPLPAGLLRPPRLAGRGDEWTRVVQALERRRLVVLQGEPGVGKSRLLEDLARALGWPEPVASRPGDAELPYALASRWLDALCDRFGLPDSALHPELARLIPRLQGSAAGPTTPLAPGRLLRAVEAAVAGWSLPGGGGQPSLAGVAIDDLQFADAASISLLLHLAIDPRGGGPAWMFSLRRCDLPQVLQGWQARLDPRRVELVPIEPLSAAGVVALLESLQLPGMDASLWAQPLLDHVGGHPFDLLDTLAMLHGQGVRDFSGPPSLAEHPAHRREAIARRLARLEPSARQLLQVAAIAGAEFSVELAAAVLQGPPAALAPAWRSLEQAGLFAGGSFAHDLVRQTARQDVPDAVAHAMHRQIATWLEGPGAPSGAAHPARIAAHWQAAGDWARAAPAFEAAAEEARLRSAGREELLALDSAARCHRAGGTPEGLDRAFDCDLRRVRLLLLHESPGRALDGAQALVAQALTTRQQAAALELRSLVRGERLEHEASLDDARAALLMATSLPAPRLRLLAAQRASAALVRLGRPLEAVSTVERLQGEVGSLDDDERLHWLSDLATTLDHADRRREALEVFERTIEEAERLGRWSAASAAWSHRAVTSMHLHRLDDCERAARRAIACAERAGSEPSALLIDRMNLAGALRDLGRFGEYLMLAEPLPQQLREAGHEAWALNAENDLAVCYAWLGRLELAHRVLSPVPAHAPPALRAARLFTEAWLRRRQAGGAEGREPADQVQRARELLGDHGGGRSHARLRLALESCHDMPPTAALEALSAVEAEALRREQPMLASHAQLLRLQLQLQLGQDDDAARTAAGLLDRCEADGTPPGLYAPEVWWQAHLALRRHEPGRAAQALGRARGWIVDHALVQLPEVFHRSFLERNLVNAAVLRAAGGGE